MLSSTLWQVVKFTPDYGGGGGGSALESVSLISIGLALAADWVPANHHLVVITCCTVLFVEDPLLGIGVHEPFLATCSFLPIYL
jgi:hypothetical protein